uniref:Glucosidase 2 subunit beta n=1 Tax=Timema californicum TaxID=61474 RepID=A0A7R9PC62_TIMCA|nr:unnamed protein product [Timema californicum]
MWDPNHGGGLAFPTFTRCLVRVSSLYSPQKDFTCLDGSATLPFIYVNDDYCDCDDGSDEPGTPACPNETFHCTNAGHRPLNIPSSRVNDGICDCCDASDEYSSRATCLNNCPELGRAARAEAIKLLELTKLGNTLRLELSKKGRTIKQETQERVRQLEADQQEADSVRKEKETLKRAAEEAESRVLEQYRRVEEEERQRETEKLAFEQFHRLDSNQDGRLETAEITTQTMFDQNKDGAVSEEEVKVTSVRSVEDTCLYRTGQSEDTCLTCLFQLILAGHDSVSWEQFLESSWPVIRPLLQLEKGLFQPPNTEDEPVDQEEEQGDEEEEEEEDQEEEGEDDGKTPSQEEATSTEQPPKYDDETQAIIDEANRAREAYEEADRVSRDVAREIKQLQEALEKDVGEDDEFAPLAGECFELTDTEYTYKLCPFDQVTQRSKSGGVETRLGAWGSWVGPGDNKYHMMLYDRGQSCWNGPQRSTHVRLNCGTESAVTSVSEPNRCEYFMEFSTPGACRLPEVTADHDEL